MATLGEAVAAARQVVDRSLGDLIQPGLSAGLHERYRALGDDAHIVPMPEGERFSGWTYARALRGARRAARPVE